MLEVFMRPGSSGAVAKAAAYFRNERGDTTFETVGGARLTYRRPPGRRGSYVCWSSPIAVHQLPRPLRGAIVVKALFSGVLPTKPQTPRFTLAKVGLSVRQLSSGQYAYTIQAGGLSGIIEMLHAVDPVQLD